MAKFKYQTITIRTVDDLEKAEKLTEKGWKVELVGFETIQLFKKEE